MKIPNAIFRNGYLMFKASSICKGYFGSKERVADLVLPKTARDSLFIEPFCGGASLSYILKKSGRKVISGDWSYYAYLHGAGLIALSKKIDPNFDPREVKKVSGYASKTFSNLPFDSKWVDGFCIKFASNPSKLLALGKILDKNLRAGGRFPTWTNKPCSTIQLTEWIQKALNKINNDIIPIEGSRAVWGPAHSLLKSLKPLVKPSVLYLDPAWPFADGSSAGKFYQFPANIGAILQQQDPSISFMKTEEHLEYILGLVLTFKEKGGTIALVATQSTNAPPPEIVEQRLKSIGETSKVTRQVAGGSHRSGFLETLLEVKL